MCYVRPFPRCKDHASAKLIRKTAAFQAKQGAEQQKELTRARMEWDATKPGIAAQAKLGREGNKMAALMASANQARRDQSLRDMIILNPKAVVLPEDAHILTAKGKEKNEELITNYKIELKQGLAEMEASGIDAETFEGNRTILMQLHPDDKKAVKLYGSGALKVRNARRGLALDDNEKFEALVQAGLPDAPAFAPIPITNQEAERLAAEQEFKNAHLSMKALKAEKKELLAEKAEIEAAMEARREELATI